MNPSTPLESDWSIRVRSVENTLLEQCKVQYAGRGIHTINEQKKGVWEAMLTKGCAINFRIPAITPIADDAWVVVLDGSGVIRETGSERSPIRSHDRRRRSSLGYEILSR